MRLETPISGDQNFARGKVTAPKSDPIRAHREHALGIDVYDPTGLGKWLVYLNEAVPGTTNVEGRKSDIDGQMKPALLVIDSLWDAAHADKIRGQRKGLDWIGERALKYFDEDARVLKDNNITLKTANELGNVMQRVVEGIRTNVYREALRNNEPIFENAVINLAKQQAALALVLRRRIPTQIEGALTHLGMLNDLKDVAEEPKKDPWSFGLTRRDYGADWKGKDEALKTSAAAYADGWAGAELIRELTGEYLGKYFTDETRDEILGKINSHLDVSEFVTGSRASEGNFGFFAEPGNQRYLRSLQKDIETVAVMMKGEEPDPVADLRKEYRGEIARVDAIRVEAAGEEEEHRRLMETAAKRRQKAEKNIGTLKEIDTQLAEISASAKEATSRRKQRGVIEKRLGQLKADRRITTLSADVFTDTQAYQALVDNFPALSQLWGFDEDGQAELNIAVTSIKAMTPALNDATKDTLLPALKIFLDQIRAKVGEAKLKEIGSQMDGLGEPIERVTLDDGLRQPAEEALRRSVMEVK